MAHLQAPPTQATGAVTNIIPADGNQDPVDTSFPVADNDNLWAYVTAPIGGAICIVKPGPQVGDDGDCPGAGWGTGFAPPFFAGFVPITGAPLKAGTWVMIATSPDILGVSHIDAVSQPFLVTHCEGCPPAPPPDPNLAKSVMSAIANAIKTSCEMAQALNNTHKLAELKNNYDTMVVDFSGASVGTFIVSIATDEATEHIFGDLKPSPVSYLPANIGIGLWALCLSYFGEDFPSNPIPFTGGAQTHVPGALASVNAWLSDPPQPYETIATADFIDWAQFDFTGFHPDALDFAKPVDEFRAYLAAGTTSFERFTAARLAGPAAAGFAHDQAAAIDLNFDGVRKALAETSRELDVLAADVLADSTWRDTITQAELDAAGPLLRRVRDTGFTTAEIDNFHDLGLSDAAIVQLRDRLGGDTDALNASMTFHGSLTKLGDDMDAAIEAIDDFARQAAYYAADTATNGAPVPSFSATPTTGAAPLAVSFDATASSDPNGDALSYAWTFGDGSSGSGVAPGHVYVGAGSYTATLTVSDGTLSAASSQLVTVTGNHAPVTTKDTDFTYPNVPVTTNVLGNDSDVDFDPLSITSWTQGSGGTVSCASPSCTYTPGNVIGTDIYHYTVSDGHGGTATGTVAVSISAGGAPSADFTATPQSGPGPLTTTLDGTVSTDPGGSIVAWAWDLGDGTSASTPTVVHTYPVGTYVVSLQVTDNVGDHSFEVRRIITATQGANDVPLVSVRAEPAEGAAPLDSFLSVTAQDLDGNIDLIEWDFGDGTSTSGTPAQMIQVDHTWTTPGDYDVSVTATDNDGAFATAMTTIHVFQAANQPPSVNDETFAVYKDESIQVDVFSNDSDPDLDVLTIVNVQGPFFGTGGCDPDGQCEFTASRVTTQQDRIVYTVSDGHGHSRIGQLIVDVSKRPGAPTANLGLQPTIGLTPLTSFIDGSGSTDVEGDIAAYEWALDDIVVSQEAAFNHVFETPGTVHVTLAVTDEDGLVDWAEKTVDVRDSQDLDLPWCGDQDDDTLVNNCLEYDLDPSIQLYQVGGQGPGTLTFDYVLRGGGFGNELATFEVDDAAGRINGHAPGTTEWFDDVLGRARTIFPSGSTASFPDVELAVQGGDIFGFILLPQTTLEDARTTPGWENQVFFSLDAINTDDTDHFIGFRHQDGGLFEFALEDLREGGDRDYNDVVYTVRGALTPLASVAVSKTVEDPVAAAGGFDQYTITLSNTNSFPVVIDAVIDDLPDGFTYEAGSSTGATTDDPGTAGSTLTWSGPFVIPALDEISISFGVTVPDTTGTYFNEAAAEAGAIEITPTGPTAPVLVVQPITDDLSPLVDAGPDGAGGVAAAIGLDGTILEPPGESHASVWSYAPLSGVDPAAVCLFGDAGAIDTDVSCTHAGSYTMTLTLDDGGSPIADSAIVRIYPDAGATVLSLDSIPDQEVDEGQGVDFVAAAHPPTGVTVSYSLEACPSGASITSGTGVFAWPTTEADGQGSFSCTVVAATADEEVSDTFAITVNEVNANPILTPPADVTVQAGELATGQASATDPDLPANTLTYSLVLSEGSIGPSSGAFSWTTALADVGDHTITVRVSDGVGGSDDATFVVHVTTPVVPTSLELGGDDDGQYTDHVTISARLTSTAVGVAGASVQLRLGALTKAATTDAQGWATADFVVPGPAGGITRAATYAGDATHEASGVSGSFAVLREDASLELPGGDAVAAGSTFLLRAILRDSAAAGYGGANPETALNATIGDITRMRVLFEVYAAGTCLTGTPMQTFIATVVDEGTPGDGIGAAGASWSNVPEGSYCISARLVGATAALPNDWYVAAPPEPIGLGVFKPATGHVTGGGWLALPNGERVNFGFNALSSKKGAKGQLMLVARLDCGAEPSRLLVKSNAFSSLSTDGQVDPATAVLTGKAVLRCLALDDGAVLWESGNATWQVTVVDGGKATSDAFGMRVTNSAGGIVLDIARVALLGGSIVAHLR